MFRRKTRNSTAYTGVGQSSPAAKQPNNNAMAAALTIGHNLKETQPLKYNNTRTPSIQRAPAAPRSQGSLLKRSPSLQSNLPQARATSTPRSSISGTSHNPLVAKQRGSVEYSVDDSFNDSVLEEMGHEADAHYSNRAQMSDLRIHHTPAGAVPRGSAQSAATAATTPVKMVKRYVPTANGIQVVEVPEALMKQAIARSNSMRSGMLISRLGSLTGQPRTGSLYLLARRPKQPPAKKQLLRLSSLLQDSSITEDVESESRAAAADAKIAQDHELAAIKRQIEQERQMARDLEAKRAEYEQLRALRLENERRMGELKVLEEAERSRSTTPSVMSPPPELNHPETPRRDGFSTPSKSAGSESLRHVAAANLAAVPVTKVDVGITESGTLVSDVGLPQITILSEESDVPIKPVPFLVDEVDEKKLDNAQLPDSMVASEAAARGELVEPDHSNGVDEFGIEEVPNDTDSPSLAHHLRPVFDPVVDEVPEQPLAKDIDDFSNGVLPRPNVAESIQLILSLDSKSKPIKSAMKNSRVSYSALASSDLPAATASNPAHQAYLLLTTAENTRLNSKLSAQQLGDELRPSPPKSPIPQKRLSQATLRKQPSTSAAPGGLALRSLRPRSTSDVMQPSANGGMSSRTFKTQPQPIAPHPALQPDYQSPSKLKAAELYARANKRPHSQFQPLQRKSSFSKAGADDQPPQQRTTRTTLRSPQPVHPEHGRQTSDVSYNSRLADSDAEPVSLSHKFSSRFADSDDDLPASGVSLSQPAQLTPTLRKPAADAKETGKPKKKKFLRKLFGKN